MFFDRQGHLVSRATWQSLSAKRGYVTLTEDTVTGPDGFLHDVQTFWIGVGDRRHLLLFCTVVTRPHRPSMTWGWQTASQAKTGHQMVCAWLTGKTDRLPSRKVVPGP